MQLSERITWSIGIAAGAALIVGGLAVAARCDEPSQIQQDLHEQAQSERAQRGLARQQLDDELCGICQRWAERMASTGRFSHGGGENIIAYGARDAAGAVRMWIGSAPHRAFVLGGSERAGWGAARSSSGTWYWAGAFRSQVATVAETVTYRPSRRGFFRRK